MNAIGRAINSGLQLSKIGGGVAFNLSNLRESGAPIKYIENAASGVIPVMKMFEDAFSYANQLGQRQGSGACYLSIHHPDFESFLDTKKENADEKIRIKTLSIGAVITDIAMMMASKNEDVYQFSPYDVEREYGVPFSYVDITKEYNNLVNNSNIRKYRVNPRMMMQRMAEIQPESGYPYFMFIDTVNRANPIDGRVIMSNLCVAPETKILTDKGYQEIQTLMDQNVNIWNGEEWSEVTVRKTGEDQKLVTVELDDGHELTCTPYHKWFIVDDYGRPAREVRTHELKEGDKLIKFDYPIIDGQLELNKPYINGFYSGDGCLTPNGQRIYLYGEKRKLFWEFDGQGNDPWIIHNKQNRAYTHFHDLEDKFFVPDAKYTIKSRLQWLAGFADADGTIFKNGDNQQFSLVSVNYEFLTNVQAMLETLGIASKIRTMQNEGLRLMPANDGTGELKEYFCQTTYRLLVTSVELQKLIRLGIEFKRLIVVDHVPQRQARQFVTVKNIYDLNRTDDTYCFTEPKRHMGVFNGVLTGQCSEILQIQTPSKINDDQSYSIVGRDISCNLGSMNIAKAMFNAQHIGKTVEVATRALTEVSKNTNIETVPSIKNGNSKGHSIGLGQMNLHGFLAHEKIHYDSIEALDFTNLYFATINYHSLAASCNIAIEEDEVFFEFEKSAYASGEYFNQYIEGDWLPKTKKVKDVFEKYGFHVPTNQEWAELKERVMRYGLYNMYRLAVPPTGSISYINNSTSSIHPIAARIEVRKEGKTGRKYYPAPFMTNDNLEYFKTAYEYTPESVIDVYAEASKHTDQGLSLTVMFKAQATTRDINNAHIYAWKKGIKSVYYIRMEQDALEGTEVEGCVSCTL